MSFKTSLLTAVDNASVVLLDDMVLDDCLRQRNGMLHLEFPTGTPVIPPFYNQEIEIDEDGHAQATDIEGNTRTFQFKVTHPMTKQDVPPPVEHA